MARWFLSFGLALGIAAGAAAAPVGMAYDLKGKPEYQPQAGRKRPLVRLQKLEPGDRMTCGPGAEALLVLFKSGERFQVPSGGQATVQDATVRGAKPLGALQGPSARVASALSGSRVGALVSRPARIQHQPLVQSPGWMLEGDRRFRWEPVAGADSYVVTVFDLGDNVLSSQAVGTPEAEYPASGPLLMQRRPYVWRVTAFARSGRPLAGIRWGVLTVLSKEDADQLTAAARDLDEEARRAPNDVIPRLLLVELYRSYGVFYRALAEAEKLRDEGVPGMEEAVRELYRELSPQAQYLAGLDIPGLQSEAAAP